LTAPSTGRSLADFTVELDVYSGPYEWLLALILKDELEIFEVPLRELVGLYAGSRDPEAENALDRDTDFAGSAAALILLKSRTLSPALEPEPTARKPRPPPRSWPSACRSTSRSGAPPKTCGPASPAPRALPFGPHRAPEARPPARVERPGDAGGQAVFSRLVEPPVRHLGPITVTLQELAGMIRTGLLRGPSPTRT
jgi:segregation and condensation protein A